MNDAAPTGDSRRCERCGEDVILIDVPGFGRREVLTKRRSTLHLCNLSRPSVQGARSRKPEPAPKSPPRTTQSRAPRTASAATSTATSAAPSTTAQDASPATRPPAASHAAPRHPRNAAPARGDARKPQQGRGRPNRPERGDRKPPAFTAPLVKQRPAQAAGARVRPPRDESRIRPPRPPRERKPV
jgi:hypothetical protein